MVTPIVRYSLSNIWEDKGKITRNVNFFFED